MLLVFVFLILKTSKKDSKMVVGIMSFIYSLSMWRVVFIGGGGKIVLLLVSRSGMGSRSGTTFRHISGTSRRPT